MKKYCIILLIILLSFTNVSITYSNSDEERIYIQDGDIESDLNCWVGWKTYHFGSASPIGKKGDTVTYRTPMIVNGVTSYYESEGIVQGYGYYALDFSKHVLGLLNYMKNKVTDYHTTYKPISDIPEFDEFGNVKEPEEVNMREAVSTTITKLVSSWYSKEYEEGEFADFWSKSFTNEHITELKKLQNKFYWQAYGSQAFSKLTSMMGSSFSSLSSTKQKALKGVALSVMEARYRNKDVQNKMNLTVKAAEGELWPFLVKLGNLDKISYDKESHRYIDTSKNTTYYEFPTFDEMIDGVYQWMYYYDSEIIKTTTNSAITITSHLNELNDEGDDYEIDWESEYEALTGTNFKYLSGTELSDFYNKCAITKGLFKKSSENAEGIFGAEELYDITSEVNYSEAMKNMSKAIKTFCEDVGGSTLDIFNGLSDYNMERTYMMAKNIVSSNRVQNEYAYYNIGTNIITYTPGLDGSDYLLLDFQRVKLDEPLRKYDGNSRYWTNKDTDNDGILDRNELGDDSTPLNTNDESLLYAKVDITGFIKKMVENELYGNDTDSINSEEGKTLINTAIANMKYNVYKKRKEFMDENGDTNKVDRTEDYEHYMNLDMSTSNKISSMTSRQQIIDELSKKDAKLEVRLYKYKSNPILKDTDFDGIDDNEDKDPKSNHFIGKMNSTRLSGSDAIEVDMNMDYRYFFMSNQLYYDELSTMSLLYANSIYMKGVDQSMHSGVQLKSANNFVNENESYDKNNIQNMDINKFKNLQVKGLMEHFGFKDIQTYYMGSIKDKGDENAEDCKLYYPNSLPPMDTNYNGIGKKYLPYEEIYLEYEDTHKGRIAIGYKNLEYQGIKKTVIGIVTRGTAEDDDWDCDFDMGDLDIKNNTNLSKYDKKYSSELEHFSKGYEDWNHEYHHAGFDIVANRQLELISEYIKSYKSKFEKDICFWVTGHSMGGAVANLIGASLLNDVNLNNRNTGNVYCYTFAAPNTFYMPDNNYKEQITLEKSREGEWREPKGNKYRCIFNIVNDDDFVTKVPMEECGWTKYGQEARKSIETSIKPYFALEYQNTSMNKYTLHSFQRYIGKDYISDINKIDKIITEFNKIFDIKLLLDGEKMRDSAYSFRYRNDIINSRYDENYYENSLYIKVLKPNENYTLRNNKNARPYQKILRVSIDHIYYPQIQMPAYFMQCIAHGMHTKNDDGTDINNDIVFGNENKKILFYIPLAERYINARDKLIDARKYIEPAHMLESYYALTNEITVKEFR